MHPFIALKRKTLVQPSGYYISNTCITAKDCVVLVFQWIAMALINPVISNV